MHLELTMTPRFLALRVYLRWITAETQVSEIGHFNLKTDSSLWLEAGITFERQAFKHIHGIKHSKCDKYTKKEQVLF